MSKKQIVLGKNLLVKIIASSSSSSIMTVSSSNFVKGQIIEVGNGYSGDKEKYDMSDFHINDIVIFNEKSAQPILLDNQRYLIIDVLNVFLIEKEEN